MIIETQTNTVRSERFKRIELMLGSDALARLQDSYVMVVGLGAVGSYAVEGLARAGVGRFKIIDFDRVCTSNINRQLYALESTIGRQKCEIAKERILDINPDCRIDAINGFVDAETIKAYISDSPDIVIDAIDSLNPKIELISAVRASGIPMITCLGAALRSDPTQIRVANLGDTFGCPLGRLIRKRLRKRGVSMDYPCVYSEEPLPDPLPIAAPTDALGDNPLQERGRIRNTLGSMPTITGIFGLTAANLAIKMLIE
ncbi:MAG: tRNA threonylcarbamoyladenosine dehydratase [Armatimonadota bacterium]